MSQPIQNMTINGVKITLAALAAEIHACGAYLRRNFAKGELADGDGEFEGTDCRLRVFGSGWQLLTGSSDYDQDHRGAWGANCVSRACTWKEAREIARALLDECADCAAEQESAEKWRANRPIPSGETGPFAVATV